MPVPPPASFAWGPGFVPALPAASPPPGLTASVDHAAASTAAQCAALCAAQPLAAPAVVAPFPAPASGRVASPLPALTTVDTPSDGRNPLAAAHTAVVFAPDALRVRDHPALHAAAVAGHRSVVPVLIAHQTAYHAHGGHCAWHAAASDLRRAVRALGGDLVVVAGDGYADSDACVARAVLDICRKVRAGVLYTHTGVVRRHGALHAACEDAGVECVALWAGTLLHPSQLPFALRDMPEDADAFATALQQIAADDPVAVPESLPAFPPTAAAMVADIPRCPLATAAVPAASTAAALAQSETGAVRLLRAFVLPTRGVASSLQAADVIRGGEQADACPCRRPSSPVRLIDTVLGRLSTSVYRGVLSPRQLHHAMAGSSLAVGSPRRYCTALELLQHEFDVFLTMKRGDADVVARRPPPMPLSSSR
jgi:hypothetical protein